MSFLKDLVKTVAPAVPVVGPIVGGLLASNAAGDARKAANRGAAESQAIAREQLEYARERDALSDARFDEMLARGYRETRPRRRAGNQATRAYAYELGLRDRPRGYAGFTGTPMGDAMSRAVDRSAAVRGGLLSSNLAENQMRVGQEDYGNHLARLAGATNLAFSPSLQAIGAGVGAAGASPAVMNAYSNQMTAANTAGATRAAGVADQGRIIGDALSQAAGAYGYGYGGGPAAPPAPTMTPGGMTNPAVYRGTWNQPSDFGGLY